MSAYITETLHLANDEIATLVRLPARANSRGAVLYVHGFVDYFFQDHVAEHFAGRGFDFYAIDLRRYGRSLREGEIPWFTTDLAEYFEELDAAVDCIRADGHDCIAVLAHSTGGLIAPLWLNDRPHPEVNALILNSPWLELQEGWFLRTIGTWVIRGIGRVCPEWIVPQTLGSVNSESVHKDIHGEWEFNTIWKPLTPQPVRFGFLAAVRRGQARLHKGLNVRCPVFVMHSDESRLGLKVWSPVAMRADTVLNVEQIEQWAGAIAPDVTTATIPGGMHDLFLSAEPVRKRAFAEMDSWLESHLIDMPSPRVD